MYKTMQGNLTLEEIFISLQPRPNARKTPRYINILTKNQVNVILWTSCLSSLRAGWSLRKLRLALEASQINPAPQYIDAQIKHNHSPPRQINAKPIDPSYNVV